MVGGPGEVPAPLLLPQVGHLEGGWGIAEGRAVILCPHGSSAREPKLLEGCTEGGEGGGLEPQPDPLVLVGQVLTGLARYSLLQGERAIPPRVLRLLACCRDGQMD